MTIDTACQICDGQLVTPPAPKRRFRGVSIDTRTLRKGNAFFCLRGGNTDGHKFAAVARDREAGAIIAERQIARTWSRWPVPVIGVDDPLTALGDLTVAFQKLFPTRYLAITGSVGKTTTKEMIAAVLAKRYEVFKSPGNYNNLIGIPLALLARNPSAKRMPTMGVLEFGMSTPGEIARLTQMIQPEWGVVTRIAPSHTMQLKSVAAVARAKRELFDYAPDTTVAFLNNDDPHQRKWQTQWQRKTVTYALEHDADFTADRIATDHRGRVHFRVNGRHDMQLALPGEHNVANALAAVAVGRHHRVSFADITDALRRVKPVGSRSRVVRLGNVTILDDCYNASPASMQAALRTLADWPGAKRRIAVLGAMRELGSEEVDWHRKIGEFAAGRTDVLIVVGELARAYARDAGESGPTARTIACKTVAQATLKLHQLAQAGDVILIKASHSEKFEDIVPDLQDRLQSTKGKTHRANC